MLQCGKGLEATDEVYNEVFWNGIPNKDGKAVIKGDVETITPHKFLKKTPLSSDN